MTSTAPRTEIKFEEVVRSYRGKQGCACGCRGRYTLSSNTSLKAENERTGFEAYTEDDVSDRRVERAIKDLNNMIDWSNPEAVEAQVTSEYAYADYGQERTVCVYFK